MGPLVRDPQDLEYSIIKAELSDLIPAGSKPDLLEVTGGAVLGANKAGRPHPLLRGVYSWGTPFILFNASDLTPMCYGENPGVLNGWVSSHESQ